MTQQFTTIELETDFSPILDTIPEQHILIVQGKSTKTIFQNCLTKLGELNNPVILNTDLIEIVDADKNDLLSKTDENLFQLCKNKTILELKKNKKTFIYPYPKADSTCTVCILFENGKHCLVIERLHEPFKGKLALPGGFLRIQLETLEECALREIKEETGLCLDPKNLQLIDVRSEPERDPRGHVIDHGYLYLVAEPEREILLSQLKAGDDASLCKLVSLQDLNFETMAFDHQFLLKKALLKNNFYF